MGLQQCGTLPALAYIIRIYPRSALLSAASRQHGAASPTPSILLPHQCRHQLQRAARLSLHSPCSRRLECSSSQGYINAKTSEALHHAPSSSPRRLNRSAPPQSSCANKQCSTHSPFHWVWTPIHNLLLQRLPRLFPQAAPPIAHRPCALLFHCSLSNVSYLWLAVNKPMPTRRPRSGSKQIFELFVLLQASRATTPASWRLSFRNSTSIALCGRSKGQHGHFCPAFWRTLPCGCRSILLRKGRLAWPRAAFQCFRLHLLNSGFQWCATRHIWAQFQPTRRLATAILVLCPLTLCMSSSNFPPMALSLRLCDSIRE